MLSGIRIYTADNIWRQILSNLGAVVAENQSVADVNFDSLNVSSVLSPIELKSIVLKAMEAQEQKVINDIFGESIVLPRLQMQIVVLLHKSGGMSAAELKDVLGYSPDIATHTIDTAIYSLRKQYGRDFIKNENGKYKVGKL